MSETIRPLDAVSPIDGRYHDKTEELSNYFSEDALIKTRLEVETKYLLALTEIGVPRRLPEPEKQLLSDIGLDPHGVDTEVIKNIEKTTRHDVKSVEMFLRESFKDLSLQDLTEYIHFGLTSEDVNNLSYRLMLDRARKDVLLPTLNKVLEEVVLRAHEHSETPMLARTHGQPAVPTTLGKEFVVYAKRLERQMLQIEQHRLTGKLNGAVGNFNALFFARPEVDWPLFAEKFVDSLGLEHNPYTTQINSYEDMIELFHMFQRTNGVLIDFDQDMWRYISDDWFVQEVKKDEVGSSTMPQKVNPIDFENSEGNLVIANGLFETLGRKLQVSRLQRDLSDSTVVRNVGVAAAYSFIGYKSLLRGLGRVRPNQEAISKALQSNWAVLAEGAQTLLRDSGVEDPYGLLKSLTRGQNIDRDGWCAWVDSLEIDEKIKDRLFELTPDTYIGYADSITLAGIDDINLE